MGKYTSIISLSEVRNRFNQLDECLGKLGFKVVFQDEVPAEPFAGDKPNKTYLLMPENSFPL